MSKNLGLRIVKCDVEDVAPFIGPSVFRNVGLESHHILTERAFLQACHQSPSDPDLLLIQPLDPIHLCGLHIVNHHSCHSNCVLLINATKDGEYE